MRVPFVDLKKQYESIKQEIDEAIRLVIEETAFIGGKFVNEFEQKFAKAYGVKHCISCANGTDSLYIIMKMLGIGEGDEVITVANSWISSSETISQTGARPVFIDIDPIHYTIDVSQVAAKISSKTTAILPVHLQGQMCDMDSLMNIAQQYNLAVIEDCAQSHFSKYHNKLAGTMGIAGSFSFYPGKNLGAYGDAGCIITNSDALAEKCRLYARHGALIKHQHKIEGINSRLDGLQAAILSTKLNHIESWTEQRIANAGYYTKVLSGISEIALPVVKPQTKHTFHLYVIRAASRDELAAYLKDNGIETAIHYPVPLPFMEAYQYLGYAESDFPVTAKYQHEILSLPMYPELTYDMMDFVGETIRKFYKRQPHGLQVAENAIAE